MCFNNNQMSVQVGEGVVDPEVNKFEQVSSDDHQLSLVGGSCILRSHVQGVVQ